VLEWSVGPKRRGLVQRREEARPEVEAVRHVIDRMRAGQRGGFGHRRNTAELDDARRADVYRTPAELLRRAIKLLAEAKGESWVNKGAIWHMIKRLDPTFDPKDHGYANFPAMVKALDAVVEVKKGESDQIVRIRA
jgi:hypothetical protein